MADNELKQFLREQARSLDSLLELTPAKIMFGEDVSDQWKRKKQTPEQKKAARMAKLDPANWKSAKDFYDERSAEAAKKRKREQSEEVGQPDVRHMSAEDSKQQQPSKKQKTNQSTAKLDIVGRIGDVQTPDQIANKNLKKKMKKRANRVEKNQEIREQKERRKAEKAAHRSDPSTASTTETLATSKTASHKSTASEKLTRKAEARNKTNVGKPLAGEKAVEKLVQPAAAEDKDAIADESESEDSGAEPLITAQPDTAAEDDSDHDDENMEDESSTASSSEHVPDILSPPQDSAASSVSSIIPLPTDQPSKPNTNETNAATSSKTSADLDKAKQSEAEKSAARQRLQEQISRFRSQRKADDKPVRSRAELLEQRRRTEAERKAAKKEQRKKEKEEEARLQDEEMAKRFSPGGSGSLLASPRSPIVDGGMNDSFTFGRIAFEDGTQLDPNTLSAMASKKQKGASDPASALKAAQAKNARIAGLDDNKKQDIQEKDMWLNARKRAHGERIRDDTSLLKKALKRQEKQKQRSGRSWDERTEGVRASQEARQKKRSDNLQKRKDEKGSKKNGKKVKRPGFEGSFRSRAGKGKKK